MPPYDFRRQWTGTWCWLAREPSGSGSGFLVWGGLEPSGESFPAAVAQKGSSTPLQLTTTSCAIRGNKAGAPAAASQGHTSLKRGW